MSFYRKENMKLKKIILIAVLIAGFFGFKTSATAEENYYEVEVNLKIYVQDYKFLNNEIIYSYIPKSGITYGVYDIDSRLVSTVESGLFGEVTYHDSLLSGKYYFQMIYPTNAYYVKDTKKYYFEVKGEEDGSIQVYDELIEIHVDLLTYRLKFEITNEEKEPLEGINIQLLDKEYNLILELTTDSKGLALTYLPCASYYIVLPKNVSNLETDTGLININVKSANFSYSLIIKESIEETEDSSNDTDEETKENESDANNQDPEEENIDKNDELDNSSTEDESIPKSEGEHEKGEEEKDGKGLEDVEDNQDKNLNDSENDSSNELESENLDKDGSKEEYIEDKSNESEYVEETKQDIDDNRDLFESNIDDLEEITESILSGTISNTNKDNFLLDLSNVNNNSLTTSVITKNSKGKDLFSLILYIITAFGLLILRFIRI